LDDDNSGTIDANDPLSLNVRIGFMRFKNINDGNNGNDTANDYNSGSIKLVDKISELGSTTSGTSYSMTYCGNSTSCLSSNLSTCTSGECIANEAALQNTGTPLVYSLKEAKKYLAAHKDADPCKNCRQKFVILISDGADTYSCGGQGSECSSYAYERRRESVARVKDLADNGYKVFVVGFGSTMPSYFRNTLEWMAFYGGTDNPHAVNSGSTSQYSIPSGSLFPSGIDSCTAYADTGASCGGSWTDHFRTDSNDPGYLDLSGYAFMASNTDELTAALKSAIYTIREATYTFTTASVQAVRTIDENYLYEASFEPLSDPLWIGHLKRYPINDDGSVNTTKDWDAGELLQSRYADSSPIRNIRTITSSSDDLSNDLTKFVTGNTTAITNTVLDVTSDTERTNLINFIRRGDIASTTYTYYRWKLGDIFHTAPLSIATPNAYYVDSNDTSSPSAFKSFREDTDHERTVANGKRIILVGANDGQLHAFKALDGTEIWSFIPPNQLSRLKLITHSSHPTSQSHKYFIDGPLSAAEIWLGTGTIGSTAKSADDWHTYAILSEGRGGNATLWSSSPYCVSGFNTSYTATYNHYCGYYALEVTDTLNPTYKWKLGGSSAIASANGPYLGQPWSKMFIGRVRIENSEKWVGFIGGGYSGTICTNSVCTDTRGKGFFVVDLSNGTILKSFLRGGANVTGNMNYDFAGDPNAFDSDNDGFLDTAYMGDTGGNIWRFNLCLSNQGTSCNTSNWTAKKLFDNGTPATGNLAIYSMPVIALDSNRNIFVYAGTGNKVDPQHNHGTERVYAIKETDRTTTYTLSNLTDLTTQPEECPDGGWYINLQAGAGEKMLAELDVFDKKLYFTTYTPVSGSDACCVLGGTARLYIVDYLCGTGLIDGSRSESIGSGVPSAPIISRNPHTGTYDVYVSTSVNDDPDLPHTDKQPDPSPWSIRPRSVIYWRDMRIE
jgi:Tfp pilus tip-associated adhesin PilY1